MHTFYKSIKTELIKKKKTGIFTLSIIIGIFLPIVFIISSIFLETEFTEVRIPKNYYFESLEYTLVPFVSFFFPVLIIIISSKITQIDHKNRGWHLMETQPTTKMSIYFSKFILLLIANSIAIIVFLLASLFFSKITSLVIDLPTHYMFNVPVVDFIKVGLKIFIISLCITAFQYVLSVVIKGFIWPILIGFLTMLLPIMLRQYKEMLFWYPYNMLNQIASNPKGSDFGYWFTYADVLSILFVILFLYIGYNWYKFKGFITAFAKTKIRLVKFLGLVLIIGISIAFTIKPKKQKSYHKTIISGVIETDKEIKTVYVLDALIKDTIAKIDVKNNSFYKQIDKKITPDYYTIAFGNYQKIGAFFCKNDSIYIKYQQYGKNDKYTILGNRIPENKERVKSSQFRNWIPSFLDNNIQIDKADYYMENIYEYWQKELARLKSRRTVDNLVPRKDYVERAIIRINLKYLAYWNKFKKIRKSQYPNKGYVVTEGIKQLEQSLSYQDEKLLTDVKYYTFIMDNLIKEDRREVSEDKKYFDAISKLKVGKFKDKLMFLHLNKNLKEATKIEARDSLMNLYLNAVETLSYKELLVKSCKDLNRLSKGLRAPNFVTINTENKEIQLKDYIGKYVVIDVWASWCGPCKYESPYFEKKALKYKNKDMVFISLNVDEKEKDWLLDIENKATTVQQLRVKSREKLVKDYNISTIPRFILIDREGEILDVDFERPSSKNFDELLRMHTK